MSDVASQQDLSKMILCKNFEQNYSSLTYHEWHNLEKWSFHFSQDCIIYNEIILLPFNSLICDSYPIIMSFDLYLDGYFIPSTLPKCSMGFSVLS